MTDNSAKWKSWSGLLAIGVLLWLASSALLIGGMTSEVVPLLVIAGPVGFVGTIFVVAGLAAAVRARGITAKSERRALTEGPNRPED